MGGEWGRKSDNGMSERQGNTTAATSTHPSAKARNRLSLISSASTRQAKRNKTEPHLRRKPDQLMRYAVFEPDAAMSGVKQ
jgi:hypothetical protein